MPFLGLRCRRCRIAFGVPGPGPKLQRQGQAGVGKDIDEDSVVQDATWRCFPPSAQYAVFLKQRGNQTNKPTSLLVQTVCIEDVKGSRQRIQAQTELWLSWQQSGDIQLWLVAGKVCTCRVSSNFLRFPWVTKPAKKPGAPQLCFK